MTRRVVVLGMILLGFAMQGVSYFLLAAPLGRPADVSYSEPRMPYAALVFILGVGMVFASAIVYELRKERGGGEG